MYQWAEIARIAFGLGMLLPNALHASVKRFSFNALNGVPWPTKIAGRRPDSSVTDWRRRRPRPARRRSWRTGNGRCPTGARRRAGGRQRGVGPHVVDCAYAGTRPPSRASRPARSGAGPRLQTLARVATWCGTPEANARRRARTHRPCAGAKTRSWRSHRSLAQHRPATWAPIAEERY